MALVRALDLDALWQACTQLIGCALPCHSCSLLLDIDDDGYRPQQGRHRLLQADRGPARLVTSLDVAAPYLDAHPGIRWYTYSQIARHDAGAGERLRAQDPAPGWRDFVHLAFWDRERLDAVLSIRLRAERSGLSEPDRAFLNELYPLLDASLQRMRDLQVLRARQQALEHWLQRLPMAVLLVDAELRPVYASHEARRLCRQWDDGDDHDGDVRLPRPIAQALRRWYEDGSCSRPPVRPGGQASLQVVHPRRPGLHLRVDVEDAPGGHPAHALLVLVPTAGSTVAAEQAQTLPVLQRLSPGERRVALLVAAGLRNAAIAERLCRSRKTVESQISSIFRKLGIGNRTQLARLLG